MEEARVTHSALAAKRASLMTIHRLAATVVDQLAECLGRLSERDRALVNSKYVARQNLSEQAAAAGCSPNSLHKAISRIRQVLRTCLHSRLHPEGS